MAEFSFSFETCNSTSLRRASRAVARYYDDRLAPSGMTMAQFTMLATAADNPGLPANGLRKRLGLDRSNYSRSLKRLLNEDLVLLASGEIDKRYRMVKLTDKGRVSLEYADRLWRKAQDDFVGVVGDEAADRLRLATNSLEKLF